MNIVITTLNYTDFQPDAIPMGLTNENIQSAINNAEKILVSLTGCCVLEVWQFNTLEDGSYNPDRDSTNQLYRTDQELDYIQDAWLSQTQYLLSQGNDVSNGSSSYSGGGISFSNSLSERPLIREDVFNYLVKARVYERTIKFGKDLPVKQSGTKNDWLYPWNGTGMNDYLTYSTGDIRYVKNHWDYANMILITDDQGNVVLKTPPPLQIQSDWNQKDENAVDYIKNKPFYYHYEIFSFHIDQTGQIPQEAFSKYSSVQIILTGHKGGYISGDFAEIDLNSGTIKKINSNFPVLNDIDNNPISNTVNLSRSSELTWSGIRHDIKNKTLINFALTRPDTLSAYKYIAKGSNANVPNTLLIGCAESDHLDGYAMDEEYTAIGWWYSTV